MLPKQKFPCNLHDSQKTAKTIAIDTCCKTAKTIPIDTALLSSTIEPRCGLPAAGLSSLELLRRASSKHQTGTKCSLL